MGWKNNNNNNKFERRKTLHIQTHTHQPTYVAMNAHKTYVSAARATNYPSFEAFIYGNEPKLIFSSTLTHTRSREYNTLTVPVCLYLEPNKPLNCLLSSCMVRSFAHVNSRDGIALLMHFNIRVGVCVFFLACLHSLQWLSLGEHADTHSHSCHQIDTILCICVEHFR